MKNKSNFLYTPNRAWLLRIKEAKIISKQTKIKHTSKQIIISRFIKANHQIQNTMMKKEWQNKSSIYRINNKQTANEKHKREIKHPSKQHAYHNKKSLKINKMKTNKTKKIQTTNQRQQNNK